MPSINLNRLSRKLDQQKARPGETPSYIDNVSVISPPSRGATPDGILSLAVTNSDNYSDPDIYSGRWVEIRNESKHRGGKRYIVRVNEDGISGSSRKVDSIPADNESAKEKVVRKVAEVLR